MSIDFKAVASFGFLSSPSDMDISGAVDDPAPNKGDIVSITGTIASPDAADYNLSIVVHKFEDDSIVTTVFDDTVSLETGLNDITDVCGEAQSWDSDNGEIGVTYYIRFAVSSAEDVVNLSIVLAAGGLFGRYTVRH